MCSLYAHARRLWCPDRWPGRCVPLPEVSARVPGDAVSIEQVVMQRGAAVDATGSTAPARRAPRAAPTPLVAEPSASPQRAPLALASPPQGCRACPVGCRRGWSEDTFTPQESSMPAGPQRRTPPAGTPRVWAHDAVRQPSRDPRSAHRGAALTPWAEGLADQFFCAAGLSPPARRVSVDPHAGTRLRLGAGGHGLCQNVSGPGDGTGRRCGGVSLSPVTRPAQRGPHGDPAGHLCGFCRKFCSGGYERQVARRWGDYAARA